MKDNSSTGRISLTSYDPHLQSDNPNQPKIISLQDIEHILIQLLSNKKGLHEIFQSQDRAFRTSSTSSSNSSSFSSNNAASKTTSPSIVSSLPIQTLGQPPQPPLKGGPKSQMCIKSAYIQNGDMIVCKIAAGGTDHYGNTGCILIFDSMSLRLSTILCEEGLLTEVRTAAACVYASKCLLGSMNWSNVTKLGLVGGGVQAIWHLRLFAAGNDRMGVMDDDDDDDDNNTFTCRTVVLKTTSRETAEAFIRKMNTSNYPPDRQWMFEHYISPADGGRGFQDCQLIHTLTPSREPVLSKTDVNLDGSFLHITCVGADSPGKRELPSDIVLAADRLVCDSITQTKERGEFQWTNEDLWQSSRFSNRIQEFGELLESDWLTNSNAYHGGLSIFDSSGLALQDLEMAQLISRYL